MPSVQPGDPVGMVGLMVALVAGMAPLLILVAALVAPWPGRARRAVVAGACFLAVAEVLALVREASTFWPPAAGALTSQTAPVGGPAGAIAIAVLRVAGPTALGIGVARAGVARGASRGSGWPAAVLVIGLLVSLTQATVLLASWLAYEQGGPVDPAMPAPGMYEFVPALISCVVPFAWASLAASAIAHRVGGGWPWLAAGALLALAYYGINLLLPFLATGLAHGAGVELPLLTFVSLTGGAIAVGSVAVAAGVLLGPSPGDVEAPAALPDAPARAPEDDA
jgi:hypothetical protein